MPDTSDGPLPGGGIRPGVVELLLDYDPATSDIDIGPAYHSDGRPFSAEELALVQSRTPAEEAATMSLVHARAPWIKERSAALDVIIRILKSAPALAQQRFHTMLRALAPMGGRPDGLSPADRAELTDLLQTLIAVAFKETILPDLGGARREEALRLLPTLDVLDMLNEDPVED